jgi:hypothetical protein
MSTSMPEVPGRRNDGLRLSLGLLLDNLLAGRRDVIYPRQSSAIIAAPFSAIIMVGAAVFPDVIVGMTEASITRSRSMP